MIRLLVSAEPARWASVELFALVDAPEFVLMQPAFKTLCVAGDRVDMATTLHQLPSHSLMSTRKFGVSQARTPGLVIGARKQRDLVFGRFPRRHEAGAVAGQQLLVQPAFGAVGIADFAPGVEFLDDFDRRAGFHIDPGNTVFRARADPHVDRVGAGGDEARQRQAARTFGGLDRNRGDGDEERRRAALENRR